MPSATTSPPRSGVPPRWALVLAVVVGAAVTADVLLGGPLVRLDHAISHVFRTWGVRFAPWPMRFTYLLTLPGQRGTVLVISIPLVAWLSWRARSVEPFLRFGSALVLLTVAVYGLKDATGRDAPPVDAVHTATGASFPSGHVANAVLVWGLIAFLCVRAVPVPDRPDVPRWLPRVARWVAGLAPFAVFVGMTILDYHWLTDFIVGACIGVLLLRIVELNALARVSRAIDARLTRAR